MKDILPRVITTMGMMIVLATTQVSAESSQPDEQNSCQTITECEQLARSLRVQIDVFDKKGIENLTNEEFLQYDELSDKLLSTQQKIIAEQKKKTAEQKKIIAEEKKKQAEEKKKQQAYDKILETLDSIQKTLKKP